MKSSRWLLVLGAMVISTPAPAALLNHFTFENTLTDAVGGVTGTAYGGAGFAAGYYGQGLSLDGWNDYVRAGVDTRPNVMPRMTWGAWAKASATALNPVRQVLSQDNNSPADYDRSLCIDHRGGGGTGWSAFVGAGSGGVVGSGSRPITAEQWTFLAGSYDQTLGTMTFYVDGMVLHSSTSYSGGHSFFDIGHNPAFGEYFGGVIDEVFVYDEVLTETQIEDIRLRGVNPIPEPSTLGSLALLGLLLLRRRRVRPVP